MNGDLATAADLLQGAAQRRGQGGAVHIQGRLPGPARGPGRRTEAEAAQDLLRPRARLRIDAQQVVAQLGQVPGQVRLEVHRVGRDHLALPRGLLGGGAGVSVGQPPRHGLVHHHPEGVPVGGRAQAVPRHLLRRHVGQGAHHPRGEDGIAAAVKVLHQAEVQQLHLAVGGHEHVGRLEVPVQHARAVQGRDAPDKLRHAGPQPGLAVRGEGHGPHRLLHHRLVALGVCRTLGGPVEEGVHLELEFILAVELVLHGGEPPERGLHRARDEGLLLDDGVLRGACGDEGGGALAGAGSVAPDMPQEGLAVHQIHGEVPPVVRGEQLVQRHQVGVIEVRQRPELVLEQVQLKGPHAAEALGGQARAGAPVLHLVYLAHAPLTQSAHDLKPLVAAEPLQASLLHWGAELQNT